MDANDTDAMDGKRRHSIPVTIEYVLESAPTKLSLTVPRGCFFCGSLPLLVLAFQIRARLFKTNDVVS